jgi:transmembrane sensor
LQDWRALDPRHEQAAQAAAAFWTATQADNLKDELPLPAAQAARVRGRRQALGVLGISGLAALLGGRWLWQQPTDRLAWSTGRGQLLSPVLPDGTRLDVAAATHVEATLFRNRREVRLMAGEIRFDVTPDPSRPFTVTTDWGRVKVLGTAFSVSLQPGGMRVSVAHGRVAVWSRQDGEPQETQADVVLTARQTVFVGVSGVGSPGEVRSESVGAWREGWLVFDGMPLADALARWNDYLQRPLRLGRGAGLERLRLTGTFPIQDPAGFLASLPNILPVRLRHEREATLLDERGG